MEYILKTLAGADAVRKLQDAHAPSSSKGLDAANSVAGTMLYLSKMMQMTTDDETNDESLESAAAATRESNSSDDNKSKSHRGWKKSKKDKHGRDSKHSGRRSRLQCRVRMDDKGRNPFPHCRKYCRRQQHSNILDGKCHWNKKYKG